MPICLSSSKIITGIFFLSLLLLYPDNVYTQSKPVGYLFNMHTRGLNFTDKLFVTGQNQQSFTNREAAFYFEGNIQLLLVSNTGDDLFFSAVIAVSRYEVTGAGGDTFSDTAGIHMPFFIKWGKGKIERLWFHNAVSASVSSSVRMLMSYLQCQPKPSGETILETMEDDPNGHCNIQYKFYNKENGADSVVKEKFLYTSLKDEYDFNELKTSYQPKSNINIVLRNDNIFPVLVDGIDKVTTRLSQKIIGESETRIWIENKKIPDADYAVQRLPQKIDTAGNYRPWPIYFYISSREFRKNIRKDILGEDSLELLVAKLHTRFADDEKDSMVLKLKSLATVFPRMAYPLASILDTAAARGKVYNIISAALLDAQTDNAVNALSALAWKHREDWEYTKGIITNTGLNPQVTDSAITIFKSLALFKPMSRTSRAAWMALGTMTDNVFKQDTITGQSLWKWLCDSLQVLSGYEGGARVKILVWGNSNQPSAFDSVTKYIKSENEELRGVAVICTGQFSFDRKIPFLLDVIKSDTIASIKNNAARALSGELTESSYLNYIKDLMALEKDSSIREALLNTINIKGPEKIIVKAILKQAEKNDTSHTVRLAATDMLRRMDD
jgi:hypothetical protein